MKKTTPLLLALVAGLALTQAGFAEEKDKATSQDAGKPEPEAKSEGRKPEHATPEHERPGPPSPEKIAAFREKMRSQMETLQKLRREGRHDEVAAKMAEMRKNVEKLRAEHGIPRGYGGPPWLADKSPKAPQADRDQDRGRENGPRDRSRMKHGKPGKKAQWAAAAHRRAHFAQRARMMRAMQHHRASAAPGARFHVRPHAAPFGRSGFFVAPRGPMPRPPMAFRSGGFDLKGRGGIHRSHPHGGMPRADRFDRKDGPRRGKPEGEARSHHQGKPGHGKHRGDRKAQGERPGAKETCEQCQKQAKQES